MCSDNLRLEKQLWIISNLRVGRWSYDGSHDGVMMVVMMVIVLIAVNYNLYRSTFRWLTAVSTKITCVPRNIRGPFKVPKGSARTS